MIKSKGISNEPIYTIGIAAKKLGVSVHALRLYEREGLIVPHRTDTNRRIYSDVELHKVDCIKQMIKEMGLNFAGIRRLIALVPCWKFKNCSMKNRTKCEAYQDKSSPCWCSPSLCSTPEEACRDCMVYKNVMGCSDLYEMLHYASE